MKASSAFLVGVNVAATLSVAAQHPALAQDGKPLATTDFLKSTLAKTTAPIALDAMPAKSLSAYNVTPRKVSLSEPKSVATRKALATTSGGVKLRPFVPNRKLPSTSDMSANLVSETAVMDYSNQPQTLDGGVSEYSTYYADESAMTPRAKYSVKQQQRRADSARVHGAAKVASTFVRTTAPRAVPGASPAVPGQVGFPCADAGFTVPPPPPAISMRQSAPPLPHAADLQKRMQPPAPQVQSLPQFSAAPPIMQEAPLQAPRLSPQEQLEMNKLVDNACIQQGINPNAVGSAANPDLYSRVGAPPFPLSLIPEPMMKDFLKGARSKKSAIAGSNLAMTSGGGVGMGGGIGGPGHSAPLPSAGFRSYLHGAQSTQAVGQTNFSRLPTAMPIASHNPHPAVKAQPHHVAPKKAPVQQVSATPEAPKPQQVMVYPPYRSQVNFGS